MNFMSRYRNCCIREEKEIFNLRLFVTILSYEKGFGNKSWGQITVQCYISTSFWQLLRQALLDAIGSMENGHCCMGNRQSLIKSCSSMRLGVDTLVSPHRNEKKKTRIAIVYSWKDSEAHSLRGTGHRQGDELRFASRTPAKWIWVQWTWTSRGGKTSLTLETWFKI